MNVTVVIPTIWVHLEMVNACAEGVRETTGLIPVIMDGGTFAENCNRGARDWPADLYIFLNDDCDVLAGWFEPVLEAFNDPQVGIVGSRLVYPDGRLQHAGVGFRDRGGLEAFNIIDELPTRDLEAVTGACMAVRAETWVGLEGFDEQYVNGYEDVDLCLRARQAGWRIRYVAESTVVHRESQSGPARWTHVRHNIARLQEQWG